MTTTDLKTGLDTQTKLPTRTQSPPPPPVLDCVEQAALDASPSSAAGVDREFLAIAYDNLKPMLIMNVVASAGTSLVLWFGGAGWAPVWLLAAVIVAAVRYGFAVNLTRNIIVNGTRDQSARWHRQLGIGLYLSAGLWTVLALLTRGLPVVDQYMVAMILSGLAAGGTGIMAAMAVEGRAYIAIMLGSTGALLYSPHNQGLTMTFLSVVFMIVMLVVHRRNHTGIHHSIELKNTNLDLVRELQLLNTDLESRIEERTEALVNAANSDTLTGLPNRRRLLSCVDWRRSGTSRLCVAGG